jgi:hypothetical protein
MPSARLTVALLFAVAAAPLRAQDGAVAAPSTPAVSAPIVSDAPTPIAVPVIAPSDAVIPAVALVPAANVATGAKRAPGGGGFGRPEALMVIGLAAIVVGGVVGGDAGHIAAVGGLVVGLYGAWLYLKL